MRKDPLKDTLQKIQELRSQESSAQGIAILQTMIKKQTGVVVAKAADLAVEWNAIELATDLHNAFERLNEDSLERDPQCWGKTAIIKALYELAWQDSKVFVQGCKIVQLEPVFGGKQDSAVSVRIASLQALVQLPVVDTGTVMSLLADLLADPSHKVRAEAARACMYCQPELVRPLLRLKIRMGDVEPRVLGACFDSLLILDSSSETVALILEYTRSQNEVLQSEALASLASSSLAEAITAVTHIYPTLKDIQVQRILLTSLGISSTQEAFSFLCNILGKGDTQEARWALEALKSKLHDEESKAQITKELTQRNDVIPIPINSFIKNL
jgi:hypothetical protein